MSQVPKLSDLIQLWIEDEELPLVMFQSSSSDDIHFICIDQTFYSPSPPWLAYSTLNGDYPITGFVDTHLALYFSAFKDGFVQASLPDFFEYVGKDVLHAYNIQDLDRSKLPELWRQRLNSATSSETGPSPDIGPLQ